jgi:hypothetical protein
MSSISEKIRELFRKDPEANVKAAAKRFKQPVSRIYLLRKQVREEIETRIRIDPVISLKSVKAAITPQVSPEPDPQAIVDVLNDRARDYGKFKDGAALMQGMKRLLSDHARAHNKTFTDDQWEALEMIVHKIGRIVNGNPDKVDHWTDIAGYAKLVADRLQGVDR